MAVSGTSEDGFQSTQSPHTAAISAFHDHTATGKLKALITPTIPSGCHCSYMRWPGPLAVHGEAVELARKADGEVGDIDHLLHFAHALRQDLAHFQRDQRAQVRPCARAVRRRSRARFRRAAAPESCAMSRKAPAARGPPPRNRPVRPCWTFASASPVAGLRDCSTPPEGSAIHSPEQAPEFRGSISKLSRISEAWFIAGCIGELWRQEWAADREAAPERYVRSQSKDAGHALRHGSISARREPAGLVESG